ncbi:hypothetical protein QL285_051792 [Trifolium repens]|nr:hypothetical protein QL285_051792 [Trifolium repens]
MSDRRDINSNPIVAYSSWGHKRQWFPFILIPNNSINLWRGIDETSTAPQPEVLPYCTTLCASFKDAMAVSVLFGPFSSIESPWNDVPSDPSALINENADKWLTSKASSPWQLLM